MLCGKNNSKVKPWSYVTIKCLFAVLTGSFNLQGGVTEEQMLKHMGANTNLTPKEAVKLLEVCITCMTSIYKDITFHVLLVTVALVARITQLGSQCIFRCIDELFWVFSYW